MKIRKGVPPPRRSVGGKEISQTMRRLDVGDCFTVSLAGRSPNYRNNLYAMAKRAGVAITLEKKDNAYTIWRIA